jgi:RNA polymerase sigma-70 factor (ECF subfamily)
VEEFRGDLLAHCYRMLGSLDDAEDAVQETLARAWSSRHTFQRAISFRAWLYRIATNACLDAIERRRRGGAAQSIGVGPFPDDILDETDAGPEARYDAHESISLAFLTALQLLPPRQRAVLILRDVLSWHAAEVAELLELSVPAVTSTLHRARTTVASHYRPPARPAAHDPGPLRSLLDRYVKAWEAADIAGLVALLRDDAVLSMPPGLSYEGAATIGSFLAGSVFTDLPEMRLRPIRANGGPAFAGYARSGLEMAFRPAFILLVESDGSHVSAMYAYRDPSLVERFGLPSELES